MLSKPRIVETGDATRANNAVVEYISRADRTIAHEVLELVLSGKYKAAHARFSELPTLAQEKLLRIARNYEIYMDFSDT